MAIENDPAHSDASASLPPHARRFTGDHCGGMTPEVVRALLDANDGHARSYGEDAYARRAAEWIRATFECDAEVYFVATATAVNGLALATRCRGFESIVGNDLAYVETDRCNAREFFSHGAKQLTMPGDAAK